MATDKHMIMIISIRAVTYPYSVPRENVEVFCARELSSDLILPNKASTRSGGGRLAAGGGKAALAPLVVVRSILSPTQNTSLLSRGSVPLDVVKDDFRKECRFEDRAFAEFPNKFERFEETHKPKENTS